MTAETSQRPLSSRLVLLMAVACGAAVANLYYAQPLLNTIAHDFGTSDGTAGLLVTASQVGYAVGLVLLVPLGDLIERRRLITGVLVITALALAATAAAPTFDLLAAALLVVGVTSVVAQILVPLASTLAAESERGRVVGKVMSGLLIGILVARTASGLLAELGGWRLVFGVSAGLMVALTIVLRASLPPVRPTTDLSYPALLRSVGRLVAEQPTLRVRMVYGALQMGQFSVLWTTIAFLLAGKPYDYTEGTIGLFGLVGLGGALVAQVAGRLADQGRHHMSTGLFFALMLASWSADRRRQLVAGGADRRHRRARPRRAGGADHQPERHLCARPGRAQSLDDGVHDDRVRLGRRVLGGSRRRSTTPAAGMLCRSSAARWRLPASACGAPSSSHAAVARTPAPTCARPSP